MLLKIFEAATGFRIHSLLLPLKNLNKVESPSYMQLCCLHNHWYYGLLRLLLCKHSTSSFDLYAASLQLVLCKGRPLQFQTILSVHVAPQYTGGFFDGAVQVLPIFHGLRLRQHDSTSSLVLFT